MLKGDDGKAEKRKHNYMKKLIHTAQNEKFALPVGCAEKNLDFTFWNSTYISKWYQDTYFL